MPAEHTQTGGSLKKLRARLTAERFVRFDRGFFGGTHERLVRAAVQRAVEKEQAFGREACIRRKRLRNHGKAKKSSRATRYYCSSKLSHVGGGGGRSR